MKGIAGMADVSISEYEIGLNVFKNKYQDPIWPKSQKPKDKSPSKYLPHMMKMTPEENRQSYQVLSNYEYATPGMVRNKT